jgi:F-type H+-transporting ATPase subunit delta
MALGGSAARRYAEALFEVASRENKTGEYRASLERVRDALGPDVIRWLRDRVVPVDRRRKTLQGAAKGEPAAVRAVLDLLLERDRLVLLPGIAAAFGELADRRDGIVKARITTPVELDAAHRDGVVRRLEQTTGKRIRPTFAVDPALLGGITIQLGDRLIDASVRAQLDALRSQLASS